MATFTPWFLANSACLVQYGVTFFSHCQSRTSRYSGGHGHVTQFEYFALSLSPGQPEKSMTTGTPSLAASSTVRLLVAAKPFATAGSGCSGLPCELRALIVNPWSSSFFLNSLSSFSFSIIDSLQCGSPG